ncbi:MAG: hypothetical protein AAGK22_03960 [Acidobacteriota bacterium]
MARWAVLVTTGVRAFGKGDSLVSVCTSPQRPFTTETAGNLDAAGLTRVWMLQ